MRHFQVQRRAFLASAAMLGIQATDYSSRRGATQTRGDGDLALEEPGTLCSGRNAAGSGLLAQYFPGDIPGGDPILARGDSLIDLQAVRAALDTPGLSTARSLRWSGWVKASMSGPHRFHFDHPEAVTVVARKDFSSNADNTPTEIDLVAGRFYPIRLELNKLQHSILAQAKLEWTPPHGFRYTVSRAMLFPPTA